MDRLLEIAFVFTLCYYSVLATCPEAGMIRCKGGDQCTRIRYLCDGDNDCGDNSDEEAAFCMVWKNNDCERGKIKCTTGSIQTCESIQNSCLQTTQRCKSNIDPRVCKILNDNKLQELANVVLDTPAIQGPTTTVSPATLPSIEYDPEILTEEYTAKMNMVFKHQNCKQLFTKIGDQCVSPFYVGDLTWLESRTFCQSLGGDLLTIKKDLSNFNDIVQFLRQSGMTKDFWIGGMYKNSSYGWQWVDESDMPLGSPIWAVSYSRECSKRPLTSQVHNVTRYANDGHCYHYKQAPFNSQQNHCVVMSYEQFYLITDEECVKRKSPLCIFEGEHPKQALK